MNSCIAIKKYLCSKYSLDKDSIDVYKLTNCVVIVYAYENKLYKMEIPALTLYMVNNSQLDNLHDFFERAENE